MARRQMLYMLMLFERLQQIVWLNTIDDYIAITEELDYYALKSFIIIISPHY